MKVNLPKLVISIVLPLTVGFLGTILTISAIPTWYATLNKPFFSPANWVFAPVWTALYILMGISLYLLWISKGKRKDNAIHRSYPSLKSQPGSCILTLSG